MSKKQSEQMKEQRVIVQGKFEESKSPSAQFFRSKFPKLKDGSIEDLCFLVMDHIGVECQRVFYKYRDCACYLLDYYFPRVSGELEQLRFLGEGYSECIFLGRHWRLKSNGSFEGRSKYLKRKEPRKVKRNYTQLMDSLERLQSTSEVIERHSLVGFTHSVDGILGDFGKDEKNKRERNLQEDRYEGAIPNYCYAEEEYFESMSDYWNTNDIEFDLY